MGPTWFEWLSLGTNHTVYSLKKYFASIIYLVWLILSSTVHALLIFLYIHSELLNKINVQNAMPKSWREYTYLLSIEFVKAKITVHIYVSPKEEHLLELQQLLSPVKYAKRIETKDKGDGSFSMVTTFSADILTPRMASWQSLAAPRPKGASRGGYRASLAWLSSAQL